MFFICHIYGTDSETLEEKVIRVTTARHYTAPNNGALYSPHLKSVMNFDEQLFSKGSTSGEARVGVGEVILENTDAEFDSYRKFAFDGRNIEVYLLQTEFDAPTEANIFFRGTIFYAEFAFSQISIYIKNRLEILSPLIQASTFAGTNNGGNVGYEGNETDLKGKTKPMVWGTCLNVPPAPINKSMQMFAVNYDNEGNRKPVAMFFNVADKGGALLFEGDVADIATLHAATVSSGFYKTCLAEGAFKVGRVPQGEVTCDVAEVLGEDSSAPRTVMRILEQCYGLVSGVDFDGADLERVHQLNRTACGYYVDEEVEGLTVITDLLGSIGAWIVPDRLGIFRSGRFDLPTEADAPVATFDDNLILMDSLVRLPTGDQGRGIPAKSYTLAHSKLWKVLPKSETLVSVDDDLREYYANEFRHAQANDYSIAQLHPLAPDLSDESLMVLLPPVKLGKFKAEDVGDAPSNWDRVNNATVLAENMVSVPFAVSASASSIGFNIGNIGVAGNTTLENQIEEVWNGKFQLSFYLQSEDAPGSTQIVFEQGYEFVSWPMLDSLTGETFAAPVVGWNTYTFEVSNTGVQPSWWLSIGPTAGTSVFGQFSITPVPLGLTPEEEAARRLGIYAARLERYTYEVPITEGLYVELGEIILLRTVQRFELTEGRKYVVIGKNVVADEDKVAFDVIGSDVYVPPLFGGGFED